MKAENLFYFVQRPQKVSYASTVFCFVQHTIKTKKNLFYFLNKQFKSPAFGWNWDALNDAHYAI
ncbi:MAG: barstar family protein [Desulfovibrio sp.]|uniref:barstar family protein n=1 Tax=Desulfovibrio sp. TaxID=885 RepID=UPI00345BC69A|nr:barstar family protein [Desulfovibrio sp.]